MPLDESDIIDRFFRPLAGEGAFGLFDDAGRLDVSPDFDLVVTTDMIACKVHFLPGDPPFSVAQKALRVNVSDLAAKGAQPLAYVISFGISSDIEEGWLAEFVRGLKADHARFGLRLLGGDTVSVRDGPVISVTAHGLAPKGRMVHRSGGRPGDLLYVSGVIGAGAVGLALLKGEAGPWDALPNARKDALIAHYHVPQPRVELSPLLVAYASAAMDISDGLIGDCDKLAAASGCSADIEVDRVPLAEGLGATHDPALLARLITGGDDYEILAAVPPEQTPGFESAAEEAGVPMSRIGVLKGDSASSRVTWRGSELNLMARAYTHQPPEGAA